MIEKNEEFKNMINEDYRQCLVELKEVQLKLEKEIEKDERDFLIETEKIWKLKINTIRMRYKDITTK